MTLRARLTAAFLAVVLGPVLLGALFVGITAAAVSRSRSVERLDVAAAGVRGAVTLTCQRLQAVAETAALLTPGQGGSTVGGSGADASGAGPPGDALRQLIERELASAISLTSPTGELLASAGPLPRRPWAMCDTAAPGRYAAIAARVELRSADGRSVGYATAVEQLDDRLLDRLRQAGGAGVSVLSADRALSSESGRDRESVAGVAGALRPNQIGWTNHGRVVHRVDPVVDQPLTLAISIRPGDTESLYVVLIGVVLVAGALAMVAAWWLGRTTTRPLTELSYAVDRVAAGDLAARVPVRSMDEVGRVGATFNRMTREMQGYVQALTASRDQLRRQLGILGDTLSSTHDLHRILDVILRTATAATGARAGVVLLTEHATGSLVGQCVEGLPDDVVDSRIRIGEGLLGGVAATGEPRRGRVDRDGPILVPNEPVCLTYVAVPFAAPGAGPTTGLETADGVAVDGQPSVRGVLAVYDRHGFDEFDDSDLTTLRTFAGQVAVALDNVRVHEEAQRLSLTDPLTGLSNYRYLRESLRREVERANRFGRTLAVLVLDLDRFKEINDNFGHAAGDAVLAEFARRVRAEIREVDFAFRQGGEEFVVLLPETDTAGGVVVAQRLCAAIRRTPVLVVSAKRADPARVPVSVSIGVAIYPEHGTTGAAVLEAADDALYAAKAAGRDTYQTATARPAEPAPTPQPIVPRPG